MESPDITLYLYGQLSYGKEGKYIQWGTDSVCNKSYWENWMDTCKKMQSDHFITSYTKPKSKWIQYLNVRSKTIKLLKEHLGGKLFDMGLSNIFLDIFSWARAIKAKINKLDYTKLKSFCTVKKTINKVKRQTIEWEKISANDTSTKGLTFKIY